MLADCHVHTSFSDDSPYPMEDVAADALRLNLDAICFTDHVDYGVKPDAHSPEAEHARLDPHLGKPITNVDYEAYFPEVHREQQLFDGQLQIACGLEFGIQRHTVPQFERVLDRWGDQLDFVLLSIHQVDDQEFWTGEFQEGRTQGEIRRRYYEEMLAVMEAFDGYDSLAHLDLIRRYDPYGERDFAEDRDLVAPVLEKVIANGKAVELNTSSWRYGLADLQPSTPLLELYRDLGGRLITLGSDSHLPQHLGSYLRVAQRRLRELGFREFVTYEHHVPTPHPLAF
ncbi:histidinol-phosphatase HisJ family protein [Olsenella sp. YH-ols2217]|uniref:Histidinol-phosphatase n=1 Tax=Kribbibacterium absianum TaxID=3044210 RepID=A0ABT6ZLI0_9ACTN|nr:MULTISPECIES: histidinol-phosphatase HisJ family protein [unclassified Olsenella]MDJ1121891.1 histidinol-phosphatase HisJ family protein [Olsenella sp. YH-ols2216]MDJ1129899.1 histidinol-phosphatase HisJ family protein [Olsenella sp. YH-ols2217]